MSADPRAQIKRIFTTKTATIASGAASSSSIDKRGYDVSGFIIGTINTAAVGAKVSTDNATWVTLKGANAASLTLLASSTGSCATSGSPFDALAPWPYVALTTTAAQSSGSVAISWVLQG